jgi:hypothetical protein
MIFFVHAILAFILIKLAISHDDIHSHAVTHEIIEHSKEFSTLRVQFETPRDNDDNGSPILGYKVEVASISSYDPHVAKITTSASDFVSGFFSVSYGFKGIHNRIIQFEGSTILFTIQSGSNIARTNNDVDLTRILAPSDSILVNDEVIRISEVETNHLILGKRLELGTGSTPIGLFGMDTVIGISNIGTGDDLIVDLNDRSIGNLVNTGELVAFYDSDGQLVIFQVTAKNETSIHLDRPYAGDFTTTSIFIRKKIRISTLASASEFKTLFESLPEVGSVSVTRQGPTISHGYSWTITMSSNGHEECPRLCIMAHSDAELLGTNASVDISTISNGSLPSFDDIIHSEIITDRVKEVQSINLEWNDATFVPEGFFYVSFRNNKEVTKIAFNEAATDFAFKLKLLPTVGYLDVSRTRNNYSITWIVTFLSNIGDLENLIIHDVESTNGANVSVSVNEIVKGVDFDRVIETKVPSSPDGEYSYAARITPINSAGFGQSSLSIQIEGKGVLPLYTISQSGPEQSTLALVAVNDALLDLQYNISDTSSYYKVEWTPSTTFGPTTNVIFSIRCQKIDDLWGSFNIQFQFMDRLYTSPDLFISSINRSDIEEVMNEITSLGSVKITDFGRNVSSVWWEVAIEQDFSEVGLFDIDLSSIQNSDSSNIMSKNVQMSIINISNDQDYGYDYIYSSECNSLALGENGKDQYLSLSADNNGIALTGGSYKLLLDDELSDCISFDASASDLEEILSRLSGQENIEVISEPSGEADLFPYFYKIILNSSPLSGIWPEFTVDPINFGAGDCEPFIGGAKHRGIVFPTKNRDHCLNSIPSTQVLLLRSSSPAVSVELELSYKGKTAAFQSASSEEDIEGFISGMHSFKRFKVQKRTLSGTDHTVALILSYDVHDDHFDQFSVTQVKCNEIVEVGLYPLLNWTSASDGNDTSGDIRLIIGSESTNPISIAATDAKILYELNLLQGIHSVELINDFNFNDKLIMNATLDASLGSSLILAGDLTSTIAIGGKVSLGTCFDVPITDLKYESFKNTSLGGLVILTKYENSSIADNIKRRGMTIVSLQDSEGMSLIDVCTLSEGDSVTVDFGSVAIGLDGTIERLIAVKAHSSDLSNFQVLPQGNWRGTRSLLYSIEPYQTHNGHYLIERKRMNAWKTATQVESVQYNFRLTAYNNKGISKSSDVISTLLPPQPSLPHSPRSLLITQRGSQVHFYFEPPRYTGIDPITKYLMQCDSSGSFNSSLESFSNSILEGQDEIQEILLSCRNTCSGGFRLGWGGSISAVIDIDDTSSFVSDEISKLICNGQICDKVKVTRISNSIYTKWKVTFDSSLGNLGLLLVEYDSIQGDSPIMEVSELQAGSHDITPDSYTNEIQSITVSIQDGFDKVLAGSFSISFHDEISLPISVDSSDADLKRILEKLNVIRKVNVQQTVFTARKRSWLITFVNLNRESPSGSIDVPLIKIESSFFHEPLVTSVLVFENVKGSVPRSLVVPLRSNQSEIFCRVSSYANKGYGKFSNIVSSTLELPPQTPMDATIAIGNNSIDLRWEPIETHGANIEYEIEWYSGKLQTEVQQITTSASDGLTEVQIIRTMADSNNIQGSFKLSFKGEQTGPIDFDALAEGRDSIAGHLRRLKSVGDVDVTRDFSRRMVMNEWFQVGNGSDTIYINSSNDISSVFRVGDRISIHHNWYIVQNCSMNFAMLDRLYIGPSSSAIRIFKWAFGYEWTVAFVNHVGSQPLLRAIPDKNWSGTESSVSTLRKVRGQSPLHGYFSLYFKGEWTEPIACDASALDLKKALESLISISEIGVSRHRNNNGYNYLVTFLSELGTTPLLLVDDSHLSGSNSKVKVTSIQEGLIPDNYGIHRITGASPNFYRISDLANGIPYFIRLYAVNNRGRSRPNYLNNLPYTPVTSPDPPESVNVISLSKNELKVIWKPPTYTGGVEFVSDYFIEWSISARFSSNELFNKTVKVTKGDDLFCANISIESKYSSFPQYVRISAHNGYKLSYSALSTPFSIIPTFQTPGKVKALRAYSTSRLSIMVRWLPPSADNCYFGGDGGLPISHYVLQWDEQQDFSSGSGSITLPGETLSYHVGGRNPISGRETDILISGGVYYVRIIAFNGLGAGEVTTFTDLYSDSPKSIGPLMDLPPESPVAIESQALSATSIKFDWKIPVSDGGSPIQEFEVEHDSDVNFSNPKKVDLPVLREVQSIKLDSYELQSEVHSIRTTVNVLNEVQSIRTNVAGADEIQTVTTTADDVIAEVQTITLLANDIDEVQVIELSSEDIDEIQLVRVRGDDVAEIQSVTVSVDRVSEVQQLGIIISGINTNGSNNSSFACYNRALGDPCEEIEDNLSGSFTVAFDFDECGGEGPNFCQAALSLHDSAIGMISCNPGQVTDPAVGGNHCVSRQVRISFDSQQGDVGSLQWAVNSLVDDNGKSFMTNSKIPDKSTAVTVVKQGRITRKGSCVIPDEGSEAVCDGEYELLYNITFDAEHSTGDVPPLQIFYSDVEFNTTSLIYSEKLCPKVFFSKGCETVEVFAASVNHGSFYKNSLYDSAGEAVKGSQPSGMVTLDYECESSTYRLRDGSNMTAEGYSATFDDSSILTKAKPGHWLRYLTNQGQDKYHEIIQVDISSSRVLLKESVGDFVSSSDAEIGLFFSDWREEYGYSGVSPDCRSIRVHSTLPIDVSTKVDIISNADWKQKLGSLSVVDVSGVTVSRQLVHDLNQKVGFVWNITFSKQPGSVNMIKCRTVVGENSCIVSTIQDSSLVQGTFKLGTMWPHEYVSDHQNLYESTQLDWNIRPDTMIVELGRIVSDGESVFGDLEIQRVPYVKPGHLRWSGGYTWEIKFLSRGGNVPKMSIDSLDIRGINALIEVSDESSGTHDLYQGREDYSYFEDDPAIARDGNQVSGSYSLSWYGKDPYRPVITGSVFPVCTGGNSTEKFTALSANDMSRLLEEHLFDGQLGQVKVTRSAQPSQAMGYSYTIHFVHENVGGDVPAIQYVRDNNLKGRNSEVNVLELQPGNEIRGTFQLRFNGHTTRPINYDASAEEMADALNELRSIAPSAITVLRSQDEIKFGPSDGIDGISSQVGGYSWTITFASNVWKDPTLERTIEDIPGNWFGFPTHFNDAWESGFSKAWGKNVGDMPMIQCLSSGLYTTNGVFPESGCRVIETIRGTEPLAGSFKLCLDTISKQNEVASVKSNLCTENIMYNAPASARESNHDGSSIEEKLEALHNVGDVDVHRSDVNERNGGYTWTITFLSDADGPCQQRDDIHGSCNSPGDLPKLCLNASECESSALLGSCNNPLFCSKLTVLDATDAASDHRPPAGMEIQKLIIKDSFYIGWRSGPYRNDDEMVSEYKLSLNGVQTSCIPHDAEAEIIQQELQLLLDSTGIGGTALVETFESEFSVDAPNGFTHFLKFYDTGNIPLLTSHVSLCPNEFAAGQNVSITEVLNGELHTNTCDKCQDGITQRGNITTLEVPGDNLPGYLPWNAGPDEIQAHLNQVPGRFVDVERSVLDKFGSCEWLITFLSNPGQTPPGSGDIPKLKFKQDLNSSGNHSEVSVIEIVKGSNGLKGSFFIDYGSTDGAIEVAFDEPAARLEHKLKKLNSIGWAYVTKDCYPTCFSGGWGNSKVGINGNIGGFVWHFYFLRNPGSTDGVTFPPGSGNVMAPRLSFSTLQGDAASAQFEVVRKGSQQMQGSFSLKLDSVQTDSIPHNAHSTVLEQTLYEYTGLQVSVRSGTITSQKIPNLRVSASRDNPFINLFGDDWRKYLLPGDIICLVNDRRDIYSELGEWSRYFSPASVTMKSPIIKIKAADDMLHVGQKIRLREQEYNVVRNGVEVQVLYMHNGAHDHANFYYTLNVTVDELSEATSCIPFSGTVFDVQNALDNLSHLSPSSIVVTSPSVISKGIPGDPFIFYLYFEGGTVRGNVPDIVVGHCPNHTDMMVPYTNVRTLRQGGHVEHQRLALAVDSGTNDSSPSFQITIHDHLFQSITTPCIPWAVSSLSLNNFLRESFSYNIFDVGSKGVDSLGDGVYRIHSDYFIDGLVLQGDEVRIQNSCIGTVIDSISTNGTAITILSEEICTGFVGNKVLFIPDTRVLESSSHRIPKTASIELILTSREAIHQNDPVFRIDIEFMGLSRETNCLRYGEEVQIVQEEVDKLFDYNLDGKIDANDTGHFKVTLKGDGSSSSRFGYIYTFESHGSKIHSGSSGVLGTQSPIIEGVRIGSDAGCNDFNEAEVLQSSNVTASSGSSILYYNSGDIEGIEAGDRIRVIPELNPKIYTVVQVHASDNLIVLSDPFVGESNMESSIFLVNGSIPHFTVRSKRLGVNEYEYDLYFVGNYWHDVPILTVNRYGDGTCGLDDSNMIGGMNRNIAVSTIQNGGDKLETTSIYTLDKIARASGEIPVYTISPLHTVLYQETTLITIAVSNVTHIINTENEEPSFKLRIKELSTACIKVDSSESDFEFMVNIFCKTQLCSTVIKTQNSIIAPNGFLYEIYFHESIDFLSSLTLDSQDPECNAIPPGGHIDIRHSKLNDNKIYPVSRDRIWLATAEDPSTSTHWVPNSDDDLSIYRVSGRSWSVKFDQYLGDVPPLQIGSNSLALGSTLSVSDDAVKSYSPESLVIENLHTGVKHYTRVTARNQIGQSNYSSTFAAIPKREPSPVDAVKMDSAEYVNEVQTISIAARHVTEVQAVETTALLIPEVQEVTVSGVSSAFISNGAFALRFPKVQYLKLSADSTVTKGSFSFKLKYIDVQASSEMNNGSFYLKNMFTPCIPFGASPDMIKRSMEVDALQDGFPTDSVIVIRSGDGTASSNFGYEYTIKFVGSALRGNVQEIQTDMLTCEPFELLEGSALVHTESKPGGRAMGSDTSHLKLNINADEKIAFGEYAFIISHLGQTVKSRCIPWNANVDVIQKSLMDLSNVDSVFVESRGNGLLSIEEGAIRDKLNGLRFEKGLERNVIYSLSSNIDISKYFSLNDRISIVCDSYMKGNIFYRVTALNGTALVLDKDVFCSWQEFDLMMHSNFEYTIYFDGQGMHPDKDGVSHFRPRSDVQVTTDGCAPFQAYVNHKLLDYSDSEMSAAVYIKSIYDGDNGIPIGSHTDITISSSLIESLGRNISFLSTIQSLVTNNGCITYTLTFDPERGDLDELVCNPNAEFIDSGGSCSIDTVSDGNTISGYFYLGSSGPIHHDASAIEMKNELEKIPGFGEVIIHRTDSGNQGGHKWLITFTGISGDVEDLSVLNLLRGAGVNITVIEERKGNELGGTFSLSYGALTTEEIPFNVSATELKHAIEKLETIDTVSVHEIEPFTSEKGKTFLITFLDMNAGDVELFRVKTKNLTGEGATITVREEIKGSVPSPNSLHVSFPPISECSQSMVPHGSCGASIEEVSIEISTDISFRAPLIRTLVPDLQVQVVKIRSKVEHSVQTFSLESNPISGTFQLGYGASLTEDISISASAESVRSALESLPGIVTVTVQKEIGSQKFHNACVDLEIGQSTVRCSELCECNFGSHGLLANTKIKIGGTWFRVSSSYDGDDNQFEISSFFNSLNKVVYKGRTSLLMEDLFVWPGSDEWKVTFHAVSGYIHPLTSPRHNLYPTDTYLTIDYLGCSRCLEITNLSPWSHYYYRTRARNQMGWGTYSNIKDTHTESIPPVPSNTVVQVLSGVCARVRFSPSAENFPFSVSFGVLIEWTTDPNFVQAVKREKISCVPNDRRHCNLDNLDGVFFYDICNLLQSELYYIRLAFTNHVDFQVVSIPTGLYEYINWSPIHTIIPEDQLPDAPTIKELISLNGIGFQIIFDPPVLDGGKEVRGYIIEVNDVIHDEIYTVAMNSSDVITLASSRTLVYSITNNYLDLEPWNRYDVSMRAVTSVGSSLVSKSMNFILTTSPLPPMNFRVKTQTVTSKSSREALISWYEPIISLNSLNNLQGYFIEWWSGDSIPEIQQIRLRYTSIPTSTKFYLAYSPNPTVKKVTSLMPWNAPPDLVRRELMNIGWDIDYDQILIDNIKVKREVTVHGFAWTITFAENSHGINYGNIPSLIGGIISDGDSNEVELTIETLSNGSRSFGAHEVQVIEFFGSGFLFGSFRVGTANSDTYFTQYLSANVTSQEMEHAIKRLPNVGNVRVTSMNTIHSEEYGGTGSFLLQYEITFLSHTGDIDALVIDSNYINTTNGDLIVTIIDGNNDLDSDGYKISQNPPGEIPVDYKSVKILHPGPLNYTLHNLEPGKQYFVSISAFNYEGYSERVGPLHILPPKQVPQNPSDVAVSVNKGFSDSLLVSYNPPLDDGGDEISRYRIELDPTHTFDNPIVQYELCPKSNRATIWQVETRSLDNAPLRSGNFILRIGARGIYSNTDKIPFDAVALLQNETGTIQPLNFSSFVLYNSSATFLSSNSVNLEDKIFVGDRVRFELQSSKFKDYEISFVSGSVATLTEPYVGEDGVQNIVRIYGGRGDPSSSRVYCAYDEILCAEEVIAKSGSMQSKIEAIYFIEKGVLVDRDGPSSKNEFIWRITFLDHPGSGEDDFSIEVVSSSIRTINGDNSSDVITFLIQSGETFSNCVGEKVVPRYGGLVKGLEYHVRVSAMNGMGYSIPMRAVQPQAPMIVPGAPTSVSLDVVSATELRIIFASPVDNGGDPITKYSVEWSKSTTFSEYNSSIIDYLTEGSPFSKVIDNLMTGQKYFFRVRAGNSQGYGRPQLSTPNDLAPHQIPGPPSNVLLGITSDEMLTVGWNSPLSDGGDPLTKYRVEWDTTATFSSTNHPPHKGFVDLEATLHSSYTLEMLSSKKVYFVRVFAFNRAGMSEGADSDPLYLSPSNQVPGQIESLSARTGSGLGTIEVEWTSPLIPHHGIPCSGTPEAPFPCPTRYGGLISSDGGDEVFEYEVEWNERQDFNGADGRTKFITGTATTLQNLHSGRQYYVRVLARNTIGSGFFRVLENAILAK